ncbi:hypothetical protein [Pedobacter sp. SYP-B3415]|uniref:hypothetical protein n=1 Tax=Pedobacter sp. SYP-B3415 TaxID=2496641 RepID=UPI00101E1335|nr:hypothetical protein [Pedobacter sp. SYP-B3415]
MESYTFEEHKHNYAVWTAARAVARNFTTTENVKTAIEKSELRKFAESDSKPSPDEFRSLHEQWSRLLMQSLHQSTGKKVSYGRAAKIIAIYLKTSVILCSNGKCEKSQVIHPPIDSRLLNKIAGVTDNTDFAKVRWTHLDKDGYWNLIHNLSKSFEPLNWKLERFWDPAYVRKEFPSGQAVAATS